MIFPLLFTCSCSRLMTNVSHSWKAEEFSNSFVQEKENLLSCYMEPVLDIEPGPANSNPSMFRMSNDKLYFVAQSGNSHQIFIYSQSDEQVNPWSELNSLIKDPYLVQELRVSKEDAYLVIQRKGQASQELLKYNLFKNKIEVLENNIQEKVCMELGKESVFYTAHGKLVEYKKNKKIERAELKSSCHEMKRENEMLALAFDRELWVYDIIEGKLNKTLSSLELKGAREPHQLNFYDQSLFFKVVESNVLEKIMSWNFVDSALNVVSYSDRISDLLILNGKLVFSDLNPKNGTLLKLVDLPSKAERSISSDQSQNMIMSHLTEQSYLYFNGSLYTNYGHHQVGQELMSVDFDQSTRVEAIYDLNAGKKSSFPSDYFVFKDKLYFTATTENFGRELYVLENCNKQVNNASSW